MKVSRQQIKNRIERLNMFIKSLESGEHVPTERSKDAMIEQAKKLKRYWQQELRRAE